jgi:MoaA/NifB/PqqE/SkfB family radical SAM enzyme
MTEHLAKSAFNQGSSLSFLWLELTNRCNLECSHCYSDSSPRSVDAAPLSLAQYQALLSEAASLGCKEVQFIGGEPTLNKNLAALIKFASEMGYRRIEVFTNLVALSEKLLNDFVRHDVKVATSIYSYDAAVHDDITGRAGSWKRTIRNVRAVLDSGLELRVAVIVMGQNRHQVPETLDWLQSLGVKNFGTDEQREFGRANLSGDCDMGELCGQCGHGTLCVDPQGTVSPCIMSKAWSVGTAVERGLGDIVASETLREVRERIRQATEAKGDDPMSDCQPTSPFRCGPDTGQPCYPCSPSSHCPPNGCQPNSRSSPEHASFAAP